MTSTSRWWALPCLLLAAGAARADINLSGNVTPVGSEFQYSYTITNTNAPDPSGDSDAIVLSLSRPGPGSVHDIVAPNGFFSSNVDDEFLDFLAVGPGVAPGTSLGGFSYISPFPSSGTSYQITGGNGAVFSGVVAGAVPEPGVLALLGTGAVAFLPRLKRRNKSIA